MLIFSMLEAVTVKSICYFSENLFQEIRVPETFLAFKLKRCHRKTLPILCHSFEDSCTTSSKFRARLISSPSCS